MRRKQFFDCLLLNGPSDSHKHGHSDINGNDVEDNGVDVGGGGGEHHCQANVDDVKERKQEGLAMARCQTQ